MTHDPADPDPTFLVTLDLTDRQVLALTCEGCGRQYDRVVIFATSEGDAYALVSVACHGHPDGEVWLDATLGSWDEHDYSDHATFSCRVSEAGAGLVDAPMASAGRADHQGARLTREQALLEPRLPRLWALVNQVVTEVPEVAACVYSPRRR